jgi:hypothetical protein
VIHTSLGLDGVDTVQANWYGKVTIKTFCSSQAYATAARSGLAWFSLIVPTLSDIQGVDLLQGGMNLARHRSTIDVTYPLDVG